MGGHFFERSNFTRLSSCTSSNASPNAGMLFPPCLICSLICSAFMRWRSSCRLGPFFVPSPVAPWQCSHPEFANVCAPSALASACAEATRGTKASAQRATDATARSDRKKRGPVGGEAVMVPEADYRIASKSCRFLRRVRTGKSSARANFCILTRPTLRIGK